MRLRCPNCDQLVAKADKLADLDMPGEKYATEDEDPFQLCYTLYQCPGCTGPVLSEYNDYADDEIKKSEVVYPLPPVTELASDSRVPQDVRDDIKEADRCFHNRLYQSFGSAVRRVVHSVCADRGAPDGNLNTQINTLLTNHVFTQALADRAHELRTLGRHGAHPEWELVTEDMAKTGMQLMKWLVTEIYQLDVPPDPNWRGTGRRRR